MYLGREIFREGRIEFKPIRHQVAIACLPTDIKESYEEKSRAKERAVDVVVSLASRVETTHHSEWYEYIEETQLIQFKHRHVFLMLILFCKFCFCIWSMVSAFC